MGQMVATETFRAVVNGYSDLFTAGVTVVDEEHEAVRAHPDRFKPVEVAREEPVPVVVEQATQRPGEKRGQR